MLTVLSACDAGVTSADAAIGDAPSAPDQKAPCVQTATQCCCFDNPVDCAVFGFEYDTTVSTCSDSGADADADASCVVDDDCQLYGTMAFACSQADPPNDPYPAYWGQTGGGFSCTVVSRDAGAAQLHCDRFHLCGRRPDGLIDAVSSAGAPAAAFAEMAWLEAASIGAFSRLARELGEQGAPRELVQAARRASREEARHARLVGGLARRHGAKPPAVRVRRSKRRTLEAIATENAVEGCVGETYGALVALWQSAHSKDSEVRRAFEQIAPDEIAHAALAWEVARWVEPRLDEIARKRVEAARHAAFVALVRARNAEVDEVTAAIAGLPRAVESMKLAVGLSPLFRRENQGGI